MADFSRQPSKFNTLEIHIVDHCILNCKGCFHFSPLSEPKFYTLEDISISLLKLKNITKDRALSIIILGGEPLLHPQLIDFCRLISHIFPNGNHYIVTNGILLKEQSEEFFDIINELNFSVVWSKYFEAPEIEKIVRTKFIKSSVQEHFNMAYNYINLNNPTNGEKNYLNCYNNICQLKGNYIYKCSFPAWIDSIIKYYNLKYPTDYNDTINRININQATINDLDSLVFNSIDFCKYCRLYLQDGSKYANWQPSKLSINEWLITKE